MQFLPRGGNEQPLLQTNATPMCQSLPGYREANSVYPTEPVASSMQCCAKMLHQSNTAAVVPGVYQGDNTQKPASRRFTARSMPQVVSLPSVRFVSLSSATNLMFFHPAANRLFCAGGAVTGLSLLHETLPATSIGEVAVQMLFGCGKRQPLSETLLVAFQIRCNLIFRIAPNHCEQFTTHHQCNHSFTDHCSSRHRTHI
ncbi:hypothetical protein CCHOA_06370 [Corynebacterium choanae]|uniref:Uncharacterized protein n=1 Tax=Corynebacterium choanae TaxID=1862358 RepID=A0A3G6J7C3_9CORY|nr:hypothetical protein CCHOA_06370 [Corynebacterium choanae]